MTTAIRRLPMGLLAALPLVCLAAGCGASHARFTPSSGEARSSLEAALTAWREAKPYGSVDATPPIHMVDIAWQGGQQLDAFQIGDEEDSGDGTKQFVVKLTMKKASTTTDVRYIVQGRDPVWVYREEDYKRAINMENGPETSTKSKAGTARLRSKPR